MCVHAVPLEAERNTLMSVEDGTEQSGRGALEVFWSRQDDVTLRFRGIRGGGHGGSFAKGRGGACCRKWVG